MIPEGLSSAKTLEKNDILASLLPPEVTRDQAIHTYFSRNLLGKSNHFSAVSQRSISGCFPLNKMKS